ncbi:transmembrane protein 218 isoform X2 [Cottoperca gobio]|uniref:Transmembrane protein 218 n=1 Tax=Cottoperca gobio TaxID=56716 RepID=A0A6J2R267_COTGO|nr:transmembrane protein 218 isoform X2 [Cottoperca gobio]
MVSPLSVCINNHMLQKDRRAGTGNHYCKLAVIPIFLLALTITLVLVFFPRSPETMPPFKEIEIVDTLFIGRYILLALVSVVFLVVFFMLLPFHFLEPVYAKALRIH